VFGTNNAKDISKETKETSTEKTNKARAIKGRKT
jgi:hypothetical protein